MYSLKPHIEIAQFTAFSQTENVASLLKHFQDEKRNSLDLQHSVHFQELLWHDQHTDKLYTHKFKFHFIVS